MTKRISIVSGLACALALTFTGAAQATTLGTITQPTGSVANGCEEAVINQLTSDVTTPYRVPGTGTITQWQINTTGDTPGAPVTLVVLRPVGFTSYTAVGVDTRSIPSPAGSVATYALSSPIAVQAGDTFGLYTGSSIDVVCYWQSGDTPTGDSLAALATMGVPASGQTLAIEDASGPGYTLNLAATFEPPAPPAAPVTPVTPKPKCKKHKKHKRSAESAKKKCKKRKKR